MKTFRLQIATPQGKQYDGEATQLSVRGLEGELGILAGHIPLVTAVREGACRVYTPDGICRGATVSGGFLTVKPDFVRLLAAEFAFTESEQ